MEKKYYFIYYSCKRTNWPENAAPDSNTLYSQYITDEHPIQWQLDCNNKYGERMPSGVGFYSENYMVVSWQELSKDEYRKFKGWVG